MVFETLTFLLAACCLTLMHWNETGNKKFFINIRLHLEFFLLISTPTKRNSALWDTPWRGLWILVRLSWKKTLTEIPDKICHSALLQNKLTKMLSAAVKGFDDLIEKFLTFHLREWTSLGLSLPEKNCQWSASRADSV